MLLNYKKVRCRCKCARSRGNRGNSKPFATYQFNAAIICNLDTGKLWNGLVILNYKALLFIPRLTVRPRCGGWWSKMQSCPLVNSQAKNSQNKSLQPPRQRGSSWHASCTPSGFTSLLRSESGIVTSHQQWKSLFLHPNKVTIHLEGKLGVQFLFVQPHTFKCVCMSWNTDSMMSYPCEHRQWAKWGH